MRIILFGKILRRRARELGLTDTEVARRAGLKERRYGFYVTGEREPDLTTLLRVADVLQTSVDALVAQPDKRVRAKEVDREAALMLASKMLDDACLGLFVRTAEAFALHQREGGGLYRN